MRDGRRSRSQIARRRTFLLRLRGSRPSQNRRRTGHPRHCCCVGIQRLGHPPVGKGWATRPTCIVEVVRSIPLLVAGHVITVIVFLAHPYPKQVVNSPLARISRNYIAQKRSVAIPPNRL